MVVVPMEIEPVFAALLAFVLELAVAVALLVEPVSVLVLAIVLEFVRVLPVPEAAILCN